MSNKTGVHNMRYLLLTLSLLSANVSANNDILIFGGIFAYDDSQTVQDYDGISPNGYYGIKIRHNITDSLSVEIGVKHESSMYYREIGYGFNGIFFGTELKL